jgi:arylformamidase
LQIIDLTQLHQNGQKWSARGLRCNGVYVGTYVDSPAYLFSERKRIDQLPVEDFVNDAVLLDLGHKKPMDYIDDEDLEGAEESAGLAVREGEVVLLSTGWHRFQGRKEYFSRHPGLSENGAQYLEHRRVTGVGIDCPCLDHPHSRSLVAHKVLLRKGIIVIENLCNLSAIDKVRFRLITLPMKIRGTRSAARAIAILDST